MLLTPHILFGVAVFTQIQNPILGFIFVLLSHYFLDLFPQKEYSIEKIKARQWSKSLPDFLKVFFDILAGLAVVFLTVGPTTLILAAAFISILPDSFTLLYCITPNSQLLKKHQRIHARINALCENKKIPAFWGVVSQLVITAAALFLLLR